MNVNRATAALLLAAALATPLAAKPAPRTPPNPVICEDILAVAESVWITESRSELGEVTGLLNGAFSMQFEDDSLIADPAVGATTPLLVIKTKDGKLTFRLAGQSVPQDDGSVSRKIKAGLEEGTDLYANAQVEMILSGSFYPEKGGSYELVGTICYASNSAKPQRRR